MELRLRPAPCADRPLLPRRDVCSRGLLQLLGQVLGWRRPSACRSAGPLPPLL